MNDTLSAQTPFDGLYVPLKIAAIFAIIGGLWILFFNRFLALLVNDPETLTHLQTFQRWFYVIVTAWLVFVLALRSAAIIRKDKRQLIREHIKDIFENPERFTEKVFATYDNNTYVEQFQCHVLPGREREERWLEHWSQPIRSGLYTRGALNITTTSPSGYRRRPSATRSRRD